MPEVSVIMPAYNAEETVLESVESVLNQTFLDFELLVINDGSTDKTLERLEGIEDPRLHIFSFANSGVSEARNQGIRKAQGKYLAFIDADDLWIASKLEDQLNALKVSSAAVVYSWVDYVDPSGKFIHHGRHLDTQGDVYDEMFRGFFIENGSNILLKVDALRTVGLFDSTLLSSEDWDFSLRLAKDFSYICVPKVHVLYRQTMGSLSTKIFAIEKSGKQAIEKALASTPERLGPLRGESLAIFYSYLFHKAYMSAHTRRQWWIAIQIFCRGFIQSHELWNLVAKRRLLRSFRGVILNT